MKRSKKHFMLVMLFILVACCNAFALEEKTVNVVIVHDSSNPKLINNFIEDVVSLLPPEMIQTLEPHLETLNREADFNVRDDYWRRKVIGKDVLKVQLEGISIKDGNELASQLGGSVRHIFEVTLRPNSADLMNDGLKKNLKEIPTRWKSNTFLVEYKGYNGQSLDTILNTLYEYNKSQKMTLYPELVKTTADLWSAIWQRGGGKTELIAKSFLRRPMDIKNNMKPSPGSRKY